MPLVLRRITWPPDGKTSAMPDYHVIEDGDNVVGRMYQSVVPGGTKWFWSINGLAVRGAIVPCGKADTRADAMAAFKAAWDVAEKR